MGDGSEQQSIADILLFGSIFAGEEEEEVSQDPGMNWKEMKTFL